MIKSFLSRIIPAVLIFYAANIVCAEEIPSDISKTAAIQKRIAKTGFRLLNANQINRRMIFVYSKDEDKPKFIDKSIIKKEQKPTNQYDICHECNLKLISNVRK